MSTPVMERVSDIQEQVIEIIAGVEEPLAKLLQQVVDLVTEHVSVPTIPYNDLIPTPREVIDSQSKFATKLVNTNKSVALGAAKAVSPLTDQLLDRRTSTAKTSSTTKAA